MAAPTLPTWDSNGTNVSAITSGHATDGFATSEVVGSGELNDYMRKVYLCLLYLISTRVLEGDYEFTDDVDIDGDLNVDGGLDVGGDASIVGELNVDGDITHSYLKKVSSGLDMSMSTNTTWDRITTGNYQSTAAGDFLMISNFVPLLSGDRIKEVECLLPFANNPTTVTLKKRNLFGGVNSVGTVISFSVTAGQEDSVTTPRVTSGYTVLPGDLFWWEVSGTATTGLGSTTISILQVNYDHP